MKVSAPLIILGLVFAFLAFVLVNGGGHVLSENSQTLGVFSSRSGWYRPSFRNSKRHSSVCPSGYVGRGAVRCLARVITDEVGRPQASGGLLYGYGPDQFHTAYNLPLTAPNRETIAIVDAYDDPNALADLNSYSSSFGVPTMTSCPVSSGTPSAPCFQKVNQNGGTSYPTVDSGWALEISLDLDIAHGMCQNCNILLVEASSANFSDLAVAENRAVTMGANVISNSWGGNEFASETSYDSYFNHPGVAVTVATGDNGYGAYYPAASQYVTAVGGTTLNINSDNSYQSESVWSGTGAGCSVYESKPTFQMDKGCGNRTIGDVSADADPNTGGAVYDSTPYSGQVGWFQLGGTSMSTPLIAAAYALAGGFGTKMGNSVPYALQSYVSNLHDVISGSDGTCSAAYLCNGVPGYDGPSGLGTPNGTGAFGSGNGGPTPTPTQTPMPTATAVPSPTPVASGTPVPTATVRPTPTLTPVPTATVQPTPTTVPQPVSVVITYPPNFSLVHRNRLITIQTETSSNVQSVNFTVNGSLVCSVYGGPYSCRWKVPSAYFGLYFIVANARTAAGNQASSWIMVIGM